jgi:hypothetical protein
VSLVNAYTRLTFLRRIPPALLHEIQEAVVGSDWSMSPFLEAYKACTAHGSKGSTGYKLNECERNVKKYTTMGWIRKIPFFDDLRRFIRQTFIVHGALDPQEVTVIKKGLQINGGTPWKIGTACLYQQSDALACGVVLSITRWENVAETYIVMKIQPHALIELGRFRAVCKISKDPVNEDPVWISYTKLTHNCKIVPYTGKRREGETNVATLIIVHATSPAKDVAHYGRTTSLISRPL